MKRIIVIALIVGCSKKEPPTTTPIHFPDAYEIIEPKNVVYIPASGGPPKARLIALPEIQGATAIWGATGRDHRGTIYVGVSCEDSPRASAHLLAINPANDRVNDLGGIVEQCKKLGIDCPAQNKIHTKILQAADCKMYFASMDESGEAEDGSLLPTHGSHLWRFTPRGPPMQPEWEHLAAVPEAVIASAVGGKFVYFLGYHGHVLFQFDTTQNRITRTIRVGSVGGHTTRNFFADDHGHAYVPRVTNEKAELVEFDEDGQEVKAHPLADYSLNPDASSHGIVGIAPLKDGSWLFTTDRGQLYRLTPRATGSSLDGILHSPGYPSCLFSLDGERSAAILVERKQEFVWTQWSFKPAEPAEHKLDLPLPPGARNVLVYGSYTRDDAGRCFVGGRYLKNVGEATLSVPVLWSIEP